jgi:rubrerythrin
MFNPFETQQIEEFIPVDYEAFLDELSEPENQMEIVSICVKCGETITKFEIEINDCHCPCCGSIFVLHYKFIQEIADSIMQQEDIPL